MDKPIYNVVSFSGGKDSTAMLLHMIELGMQIDCILFCDTGLEFPAMYDHVARVEQDIGRPITRIRCDESFEYLMFDHHVKWRNPTKFSDEHGLEHTGYGWAGPKMRWCTEKLKNTPRERFLRTLREDYDVIEYVGIAADEGYRMSRKCNQKAESRHPLIDWGWTEADCLSYCKEKGYDWGGLYEHFHRVSCWCCPLQSLDELRQLFHHYPDLWAKLKEWDERSWRQFRADYSVEDLEVRFLLEDECLAEGRPIRGKEFFTELRKRLDGAEEEPDGAEEGLTETVEELDGTAVRPDGQTGSEEETGVIDDA